MRILVRLSGRCRREGSAQMLMLPRWVGQQPAKRGAYTCRRRLLLVAVQAVASCLQKHPFRRDLATCIRMTWQLGFPRQQASSLHHRRVLTLSRLISRSLMVVVGLVGMQRQRRKGCIGCGSSSKCDSRVM